MLPTDFPIHTLVTSPEHPCSVGEILRVTEDGLTIQWVTAQSDQLPLGHVITEFWETADLYLIEKL
jgi:hypothetical protein